MAKRSSKSKSRQAQQQPLLSSYPPPPPPPQHSSGGYTVGIVLVVLLIILVVYLVFGSGMILTTTPAPVIAAGGTTKAATAVAAGAAKMGAGGVFGITMVVLMVLGGVALYMANRMGYKDALRKRWFTTDLHREADREKSKVQREADAEIQRGKRMARTAELRTSGSEGKSFYPNYYPENWGHFPIE
jgi:hypothetical protein